LRFRLRARTSFLSALSPSNFSEFGRIVAAIGVANGWLSEAWLVTLAIALSISFILAAPLNGRSHRLYEHYRGRLRRLQGRQRIPEEAEIVPGEPRVLILGMGPVGVGAYDAMVRKTRELVLGVDLDARTLERNLAESRRVIRGSAVDPHFWSRLQLDHSRVRLVLLAMPAAAGKRPGSGAAAQVRFFGADRGDRQVSGRGGQAGSGWGGNGVQSVCRGRGGLRRTRIADSARGAAVGGPERFAARS
jgi:hypothetical protein